MSGFHAARRLRTRTQQQELTTAELLAKNEQEFQQKFSKFKKQVNIHKKLSKLNAHQFEWKKEQTKLIKARKQVEHELHELLLQMCAHKKDSLDESKEQFSFVDEIQQQIASEQTCSEQLRTFGHTLILPIRRAKNMLTKLPQSSPLLPIEMPDELAAAVNTVHSAQQTNLSAFITTLKAQHSQIVTQLTQQEALVSHELSYVNSSWLESMSNDETEQVWEIPMMDATLMAFPAEELERHSERRNNIWNEYVEQLEKLKLKYMQEIGALTQELKIARGKLKSYVSNSNSTVWEDEEEDSQLSFPIHSSHSSKTLNSSSSTSSIHSSSSASSASSASSVSSLTPNELVRIKQLYHEYASNGKKQSELLSRCCIELPRRSKKEIELYIEYLNKCKYTVGKKKALKNKYLSDVTTLKAEAIESIQQVDNEMVREYEHELQLITMQIAQQQLHHQLASMRLMKFEQQLQNNLAHQLQQEEQARAQEAEMKQLAQFRQQQKELIAKYHAQVTAELERVKAIQLEQAREQIEQAKQQAVINAERIEYRSHLLRQREVAQQARAADAQRELEERLARLEALRLSVAVEAERDPERLLAPTAASAAETQDACSLFPVHGYSLDQLMVDKRFRVAMALYNAGLQGNEYGRQIIQSFKPQPIEHMQSSVFGKR